MRLRFRLADIFWLTLVVAMSFGCWITGDRNGYDRRKVEENEEFRAALDQFMETAYGRSEVIGQPRAIPLFTYYGSPIQTYDLEDVKQRWDGIDTEFFEPKLDVFREPCRPSYSANVRVIRVEEEKPDGEAGDTATDGDGAPDDDRPEQDRVADHESDTAAGAADVQLLRDRAAER